MNTTTAPALIATLAIILCPFPRAASAADAQMSPQKTAATPALLPSQHRLSGMVTDLSGKPAPGVEVRLFPEVGDRASCRTDSNGRYEVIHTPMSDGPPYVSHIMARDISRNLAVFHKITNGIRSFADFEHAGGMPRVGVVGSTPPLEAQNITNDITGLDLQLLPAVTVTATVRSSTTGLPVTNAAGALTIFWGQSGAQWTNKFSADSAGRIQITALPRFEKIWLKITAPGFAPQSVTGTNFINSTETEFDWPVALSRQ